MNEYEYLFVDDEDFKPIRLRKYTGNYIEAEVEINDYMAGMKQDIEMAVADYLQSANVDIKIKISI